MKRLIIFITACIIVCSANAQIVRMISSTNRVEGKSAPKVQVDVVMYRITYDAKMTADTTKTPYNYNETQMRLDIGQKATRFYDYTKAKRDSIIRAMVKEGNLNFDGLPKGGNCTWEYFKGYPEEGKSTFIDIVGKDEYQCVEDVETPDWEIIPDSTATIIGYTCQLAKTRFKGRTWFAWYAEDIPMGEGPWKLCGLPGLILRAYDAPRQYVFDAAGMSNESGRWNISFSKRERETVSQKDLREIQQKFDIKNLITSGAGIVEVKSVDSNGNVSEGSLDKLMKRKLKMECNPIELE